MAAPLSASNDGGGGFRLDVEAAEAAVRKLEDVQREIKMARDDAVKISRLPPSAQDAISVEAFSLLAQKADGGPGSFTASMDAAFAHVGDLIVQMRTDIRRQRELDDAGADAFSSRA